MNLSHRLFSTIFSVTEWFKRRFTPLGIGAIACLIVSAIIGIDTKQTMGYQIFAFVLAMLIIAIAWSWRFKTGLAVSRSLPRFGTVGVKLRYTVTIDNPTGKVQTGLLLKEEFADPRPTVMQFKRYLRSLRKKSRFVSLSVRYYRWLQLTKRNRGATPIKAVAIPPLQPHSSDGVTLELMPTRRGTTRFAGVTILRPDPLSLFNACKRIIFPQSILILPQRYQVPRFELSGSRKAQSGTVSLASSVGDSAEFMSLRDYRPRDPLRKIHWKSWAKTDKPVVKEEQAEHFVRHALILDTFCQVSYSEAFESAVSVAASFACDWQTQESLLDLMFVHQEAYSFTAGRSLGNTEQMLSILAGVQPCDGEFKTLTTSVIKRSNLMSGCICVLLSWDETRKELLRYLQQMQIPTLVLVVSETQPQGIFEFGNVHWLEVGKVQQSLMSIQ